MVKVRESQGKKKVGTVKGYTPMIELVNYKRMEGNLVVDKDDHYQAFLKIGTKNIYALSMDERYQVMSQLTNFVRLEVEDVTIVAMKFPSTTDVQQQKWTKKLLQAKERRNSVQIKLCQDQIVRMILIEKNLSNIEFYLMVYADTEESLKKRIKSIQRSSGYTLNIKEVSASVVESVLFKMHNMNTEVTKTTD